METPDVHIISSFIFIGIVFLSKQLEDCTFLISFSFFFFGTQINKL